MDNGTLLDILKMDLHISTDAFDSLLLGFLETAKGAIEKEGITIVMNDTADAMLVETYAAWLYRKRNENVGMPRFLIWMLNNRLFSEKASEVSNG